MNASFAGKYTKNRKLIRTARFQAQGWGWDLIWEGDEFGISLFMFYFYPGRIYIK
jgi:hypothetical protein